MRIGVLNGYRYDIPDQPVFSVEDGYVEASHALLVQAMTPDREIDGRTLCLFRDAVERLDLSNVACANAVNALLAMYQSRWGQAPAVISPAAEDLDLRLAAFDIKVSFKLNERGIREEAEISSARHSSIEL